MTIFMILWGLICQLLEKVHPCSLNDGFLCIILYPSVWDGPKVPRKWFISGKVLQFTHHRIDPYIAEILNLSPYLQPERWARMHHWSHLSGLDYFEKYYSISGVFSITLDIWQRTGHCFDMLGSWWTHKWNFCQVHWSKWQSFAGLFSKDPIPSQVFCAMGNTGTIPVGS